MPLWFLIPVLGILVLEGIFIYKAAANRKRAKLLAGTPVAKVAELGGGLAKVEGRVMAFGQPMPAPLSGKPCVYFQFQVDEKKTRHAGPHGGGGSHWKTVINDVQSIPCVLDDGTGVAGLDLRGAEMLLSQGGEVRSGFFNDAPAELERLLRERYGRSSKGLLFNKGMRYTETLLEQGDHVLVLGTPQATSRGDWQFCKQDGLYIVSDRSEQALVKSYKRFALLWLILAVLVLIVPCVVVALVLFR